jgi:hypothetical protein
MLLQQEDTQNIIVSQVENFATQNRPSLKDVACKTIIGLGYNLIPASVHKKSLVKWRAYQEKQVSLSQYQQWLANPWQASPINWLILMGRKPYSDAPGLVALDADDQQAMNVVEGRCPPTPLWTDTSRGRQYLYRRPDGPARVKSRNKTTIDGVTENLDIKADGGYVVAPGSQHASGHIYRWSQPWTRELLESLPIYDPAWLPHEGKDEFADDFEDDGDRETAVADIEISVGERVKQARAWLADQSAAQQSYGNSGASGYCFKLAIILVWEFGLPKTEACELLHEWGQRSDQVDADGSPWRWRWDEIRHKVNDATRASCDPERIGCRLDPYYIAPEDYVAIEEMVTPLEPELVLEPEPSPEPVVTVKPSLQDDPRFAYLWQGHHQKVSDKDRANRIKAIKHIWEVIPRDGFFPAYMRYWLPTSDCPVKFHLASALALVGHLMNRKVSLRMGGVPVFPTLWVAVLAESSTLHKSTAIRNLKRFLRDDPDYCDTLLPDSFTMEALITTLGWQLPPVEDGSLPAWISMRQRCDQRAAEERDYTKGVGLFHIDELGGWLAGLEKSYNLGGKALITEWYDKDNDFRRETKGSGTYYIYKPRLSILAASTVQWLTQNCQESDLMGGFLPRWLFFHETKKDYILSVRDDPVEDLWPELEDHLRRIKGHHGEVRLSSGAFDYYWDWRREIEESAEPAVKGWVNRLGDNAFKVAVIYEASVADHLAEISETNMKLACNLMSTIKTDLVDLLANELAWTEEGKELQKVIRRIREAGKTGIFHNHLLKALSPMRSRILKEHIQTLDERGELRIQKEGKGIRYSWAG